MKKLLLIALMAVGLATFAAGCDKTEPAGNSAADMERTGKKAAEEGAEEIKDVKDVE